MRKVDPCACVFCLFMRLCTLLCEREMKKHERVFVRCEFGAGHWGLMAEHLSIPEACGGFK